MEALHSQNPSVFQPFPHRDPYGLDNMYISGLCDNEIWNLGNFHKPDLLSFSFLALRSIVYKQIMGYDLVLTGASKEFRKGLGRKDWDLHLLPKSWKSIFPQVLGEEKESVSEYPFPLDLPLEIRFDWEDGKEKAGMGILSEINDEIFPRILDALIGDSISRVYLRTSRQSFLYIPNLGLESKKGLFVQDKETYGFPEFYYYWITN